MQGTSLSQQASSPAGGRLKYADPRDLPSYPSLGLKTSASAASAAASLGWASQKQLESQRSATSISASASAAALLAHDNQMPPPSLASEASSSASLRAATLAAGGQSSKRDRSAQSQALSSNAASQAYKQDQTSPRPTTLRKPQASNVTRRGSIIAAASGAMLSDRARPRAQSSPLTRGSYPDQENAAANALSAATLAHRPSMKITDESGAVPYTTMPRAMFTSTPPVKPELDEQKSNDRIHSEAVAMARKIYIQQQAMFDTAKKAHGNDGRDPPSPGVTSLQDTAYKLAQQRLSKIEGETQRTQDYQNYYGATSPTSRRFGGRGVLRRRASSDSDVVMMQDRHKSDQIRRQMSIFNHKVSEVDEKKRNEDRQALLALARRNVSAQLAGMDSKITEETGWVTPSSRNEWDLKAQAAARQRSDERAGINHQGQVDIGGGKFMDMKAVEEIASKRMKPVLDEIHEKAEKERARLDKLKAEEKKAKEKEIKEAQKKQRDQEKQEEREKRLKEKQQERERKDKEKEEERARRDQQKEEERQRKEEDRIKKDEEKAAKQEQKKRAKEERLRTRELAAAAKALKKQQEAQKQGSGNDAAASDTDASSIISESRPSTPVSAHSQQRQQQQGAAGSPSLSTSPGQGNLKTWLKTRLVRPRGRSNASGTDREDGGGFLSPDSRPSTRGSGTGSGFIGGAALTRSNQSLPGRSYDTCGGGSMRGDHDFLREGESEIPLAVDGVNRPVSPLSSIGAYSTDYEDVEEEFRPRSRVVGNLAGLGPPPVMRSLGTSGAGGGRGGTKVVGSGSLPRDSRFQEMMD